MARQGGRGARPKRRRPERRRPEDPAIDARAPSSVRSAERPVAAPPAAWLIVAAVCFVAFVALGMAVARHTPLPFDQSLLAAARTMGWLNPAWQFLSAASNIPLIAIGIGIVLWLLWKGRRRDALIVIAVLIAATAGSEAVKQFVARPRPLGTDPTIPGVVYSFPSGHVLEATTIFGIIAIMVWRSRLPAAARAAVPIAVALFVVLVGLSRVALAEHYPSDVLAGALAGIGDLSLFAALSRPGRARHAADPGSGPRAR